MNGQASFSENIEYLNDILSSNPQSVSAFRAARYHLDNGDYKKAILLCEDSLMRFPEYLTGYLILINSYIYNSDYTSATTALKKANKVFPNHWVFKPIIKALEEYGIDASNLLQEVQSETGESSVEKYEEIDDTTIDKIVEESKTGSLVDTFDMDNYINEAAIEEIDKSESVPVIQPIVFPDEYLTINDFKPAEKNVVAGKDEIIDSIMQESDSSDCEVIIKSPLSKDNSNIDKQAIKIFNDKYNLENELSQLLSGDDLKVNDLQDDMYENIVPENSEIHTPPKLISKTLAEVYELQGRYSEAIEIYKALLKNDEITLMECDSKITQLQNKITSDITI